MFGVTRKTTDPMLELLWNLQRRMGRTYEPFGMFDWQPAEFTTAWTPAVDIVEEPDAIRIVAEIPGVPKERVEVLAADGRLEIRGDAETEVEETGRNYHHREIGRRAYFRSLTLPPDADLERARARVSDGCLTVDVPKRSGAVKGRKVPVE